jgi:serine phosphatase RsbU (regulator of sigma subunit)
VRRERPFQGPLILTLAFLAILVLLLIVGGLVVRSTVNATFRSAEQIRLARTHVSQLLAQQLDEETGVRGYAVVALPIMLEAYYGGRASMPLYVHRVRSELVALNVPEALPSLHDAVITNYRWLHEVAFPIIRTKGRHTKAELRGKALVDRFRRDISAIDAALAGRVVVVAARAQQAVYWVDGFALGAVFVVILAASLFAVQQYRLGVRLERQRTASEAEREKSAEARAAYETEKRIADVLQQAFSERLFPALPALRFSATYVPASEQAKVGGDWYDALQLSEDRVLLAIGDVTGHGIEAVVAMNKARQLLIGAALLDSRPHEILAHVNATLVRARAPIITAVAGIIDTRTGKFDYAAAGHPPPVLYEPELGARLLEFGSLPLGVAEHAEYSTHRVQTVPGAMIVLYTDGVIEYSHDLAEGEAALLRAAELAAPRPADAANTIRDRIFGRRAVSDDVAILTVTLSRESMFTDGSKQGTLAKLDPRALRRSS